MHLYISSDVDKKNPWKGLESRAGNLLGAITMPVFAAHVYVNFRFAFPLINVRWMLWIVYFLT